MYTLEEMLRQREERLGKDHPEVQMLRNQIIAEQSGLRTAFVAQPGEFGPNTGEAIPTLKVDIAASTFQEFALRMVP